MSRTLSLTNCSLNHLPFCRISFTVLQFTDFLFLFITVGTSVSPARLSESAHLLDHCIQEIKLKIQRHKTSNLQGQSSRIVERCTFFDLIWFF